MKEIHERSVRSLYRSAEEREIARVATNGLFERARSEIEKPLRKFGFKGSKTNFYRDFEDVSQIVNIAKARKYTTAFEFYLDIHFGIWSPRIHDVYEQAKPPRTEVTCQFRYSLLPPMKTPNHGLGWYVSDEETLASCLGEVLPILVDTRLPQLQSSTTLEGVLDSYKSREILPLMKKELFEAHLTRVLGEW